MRNYKYDKENDIFFTFHKGQRYSLGYNITGKHIHVYTYRQSRFVEGIGESMSAAVDNLLAFMEHRDHVSPFEEDVTL